MKKPSMIKRFCIISVIILMIVIAIFAIINFVRLPTKEDFKISNINWDCFMVIVNIINIMTVVVLYIFTYKKLDKRTLEREKNKAETSLFLIQECYKECLKYIDVLKQETVEKHIIPKIDFNSTKKDKIIDNLQNAPFINKKIIMDLVMDGQLTKKQIEKYFKIMNSYQQFVLIRIVLFDNPNTYETIKSDLINMINDELQN